MMLTDDGVCRICDKRFPKSGEGEGGLSTPPSLRRVSPFIATMQVLAALVLTAGWVGGMLYMYEFFLTAFVRGGR